MEERSVAPAHHVDQLPLFGGTSSGSLILKNYVELVSDRRSACTVSPCSQYAYEHLSMTISSNK